MKLKFLFFAFSLLCVPGLMAQTSQLVLSYKKSGDVRIVEEGERIKVVTEDRKRFKGDLGIASDSVIVVGDYSFALKSIIRLKARTLVPSDRGVGLTTVGGFTTLLGVAAVIGGSASIEQDGLGGIGEGAGPIIVGIVLIPAGVVMTSIGVVRLSTRNKYKMEDWDYSIRNVGK